MTDASPANPPQHLILALTRILRREVRLLMRHQVTYSHIAQLLKGVCLEVALRDLHTKRERVTDSRLRMLRGVHPNDNHRLREEPPTTPVRDNHGCSGTERDPAQRPSNRCTAVR